MNCSVHALPVVTLVKVPCPTTDTTPPVHALVPFVHPAFLLVLPVLALGSTTKPLSSLGKQSSAGSNFRVLPSKREYSRHPSLPSKIRPKNGKCACANAGPCSVIFKLSFVKCASSTVFGECICFAANASQKAFAPCRRVVRLPRRVEALRRELGGHLETDADFRS